jgi:hypothetical protein
MVVRLLALIAPREDAAEKPDGAVVSLTRFLIALHEEVADLIG